MNIFDHLKNICYDKTRLSDFNVEEKKTYNKYMINRYVSMANLFVPMVNEINKYDLPDFAHADFYIDCLPKRKQFFKYIKKKKDNDKDKKEKISKYFRVGKKEAEQYLKILDDKIINEILESFEYGQKVGNKRRRKKK